MRKKERAALIVEALKEHYPASCSLVARKDYELLFATRLSAQCTDARVNVVTKELFSRWDSLEAIAGADLSELMEVVKPCGLYRVKAMDIQKCVQALLENHGGKVPDTMEELLNSAMNQNFIPVVDDSDSFIGIVTRKDIIRYFSNQRTSMEPALLRKIV